LALESPAAPANTFLAARVAHHEIVARLRGWRPQGRAAVKRRAVTTALALLRQSLLSYRPGGARLSRSRRDVNPHMVNGLLLTLVIGTATLSAIHTC
jgi:hypothetical protein